MSDLRLRERGRFGEWQASAGRLIELVGVGFSCEDLLTDPSDLVSGSRDSPPTITGIGSDDFRSKSVNLGEWVDYRVKMDNPTYICLFFSLTFFLCY